MLHLTLVAPETGEAYGGAEPPGFGLLLARGRNCALETSLRLQRIPTHQCGFTSQSLNLSRAPPFLSGFDEGERLINAAACFLVLIEFSVWFRRYAPDLRVSIVWILSLDKCGCLN